MHIFINKYTHPYSSIPYRQVIQIVAPSVFTAAVVKIFEKSDPFPDVCPILASNQTPTILKLCFLRYFSFKQLFMVSTLIFLKIQDYQMLKTFYHESDKNGPSEEHRNLQRSSTDG